VKFHIHIGHHFFGAGNFGDDLMLAGFLRSIRPHLPEMRLTCCIPHDRLSQQNRFPEIEWCEYNAAVREEMIQRCDVWLGLGDTPFQTDVGMWFLNHLHEELVQCKRYSKPMYFLCVGINNITAIQQEVTRALVDYAAYIWTRDELAAGVLAQIRGHDSIATGSDLAHIYLRDRTILPPEPNSLAYLLIFENEKLFEIAALYEVMDKMRGRRQHWLVQEVRTLPGSENELLARLDVHHRSAVDVRIPDYRNDSINRYLQRWGAPEILLTSRYHAAILGAWMGSRILTVARNDKLKGLISQMDITSLEMFTSSEQVIDACERSHSIQRDLLLQLADEAAVSCDEFLSLAFRKNS